MREKIAEPIEQLEALDAVLEPLQKAVQTVVPQQSQLKDVLSGTWLGEPLHPPLTDVVIGTWTSALLLDLLGGEQAQKAADGLVAAGVLAAVPTLTAGLSDWAELSGGSRRVGGVHALGNTTALVLHALSWAARRRGNRVPGVALSALGYAVAAFSAYLGGHLSFARGVGVNQTAFEDPPDQWTAVLGEDGLEEGKLTGAQADGVTVLGMIRSPRNSTGGTRRTGLGAIGHGWLSGPTPAAVAAGRGSDPPVRGEEPGQKRSRRTLRISLTCGNASLVTSGLRQRGFGGRVPIIAVRFVPFACLCPWGWPVPAGVFPEDQLERLRTFPAIGRDDLIRYFTLTRADVAFLDPGRGRGPADRLGLAVALATLPWLGFVPDEVRAAPPAAVARLAQQLRLDPAVLRG